MKIFKFKHFKLSPVFGIGYWYDDYSGTFSKDSYAHNILLPFCRIMWGQLVYEQTVIQNGVEVTVTKAVEKISKKI